MNRENWENLSEQCGGDFTTLKSMKRLEEEATFLGLIALRDPLRKDVSNYVEYAQKGRMNVRMITADHIETACSVAIEAKILDEDLFAGEM